MRRSIIAVIAVLIAVGTGVAQAQTPLGMELRGGAAFPTADLGSTKLNTGAGGEFTINFQVMPHLLVYGGWDWFRLTTDGPFLGSDYDVENTGYAFGLQFQHPVFRQFGYWVRGGGIYNHIELEDDGGARVSDSGHELGWEAGGGARLPISERFAFTPGVRYRTLSTELTIGAARVDVDLSYVAAEIGFQWNFGAARGITAMRTR